MLRRLLIDLLLGRWRPPRADAPAPVATPPRSAPVVLRYRPDVFDVPDEEGARRIILTPEGDESTQSRWKRETPWLVHLAIDGLGIRASTRVVDYGCGIGRLARGLIEATRCAVTGVDISASMRSLAASYVDAPSFEAIDPDALAARAERGVHADAAIACWVLQHCLEPSRDIARLQDALRPGGRLLVVNNHRRAVPADGGWVDDGIDVAALLDQRFRRLERRPPDAAAVGPAVAQHAFVAFYQRE